MDLAVGFNDDCKNFRSRGSRLTIYPGTQDHPQAETRIQKTPPAGSLGALVSYRKMRLRCATLFNRLGTFFSIALTRIVTVRRVFLGRILLVGALSAFVRRVFLGLVHRSSGLRLLRKILFIFVSHEL